jgi:hypothetical protein
LFFSEQTNINQNNNNMITAQDNKGSDKTEQTGVVRMGREVPSKKASDCGSGTDSKCSDAKEKNRKDQASSLV